MNAIIFTALLGIIMMFLGAFGKDKSFPKYVAIIGTILLLVVNGIELYTGHPFFDFNKMNMFVVSSKVLIFLEVLFVCLLFLFLLNSRELETIGEHVSEYYALIFFITCGIVISCLFNHLLLMFLGIEIMSIPLYVLAGAEKRNLKSNEASLKYFLMGAFSTGIMLMGIAFIFGGNPNASMYINNIAIGSGELPTYMRVGMILLMASFAFKVGAAPFHFWTPDVYDGSPTVITSFMSTLVKLAAFYAFIHAFENMFGIVLYQWQSLVVLLILATLLIGNITAIFQQSVKRMLAYSSIAQAGFMLFALFSLNDRGQEGLLLYAAAYSLATIGLFAIVSKMKDYSIDGFRGLGKQEPTLALTATIFLLSLTGIPLTVGFLAKFYMLMAALDSGGFNWMVIIAVIFAAISSYYYFRVIWSIYFKAPEDENSVLTIPGMVTKTTKITLIVIAALIIILGILPEIILGWMYHK